MPALLELLDQYFFADVPGMQTRIALIQAWEQTAGMTRQELYIQSTADALAEELPHLSAYSGYNTLAPSHQDLAHALTTDLDQAGNALRAYDLSSGAYLTELARAMQAQRLILINQHNLFTDEYRQILLNLFDFAHARFKRVIADQPDEFAAALNQHTQNDSILTTSIATFLARQFGVILPIHSSTLPPPPPLTPGALESIELFDETPPLANLAAANETQLSETPPAPPQTTAPLPDAPRAETIQLSAVETTNERTPQNRLRVLLATPADVASERALLTQLIHELSARARTRFGLDLELILPTRAELGDAKSAVELADIFIGAVWLQFGATAIESDKTSGENYFAGAESDFALALEQAGGRAGGWLRTVIYRSIRPPLDLLHLNVAEYTRVQQFFERAGAFAGEDFVRVYNDTNELRADAYARLEAWIYNYIIDLANALTEYGKNFARAGQLTDALADLEQAGALYHELDRPEQELNIWLYAATLYRQANQPAQAAQTLDAALRLARLTDDDRAGAVIWHQRGLLAADAQDWRGALDCLRQARGTLEPDAAIYRAVVSDEIAAHAQLGDAANQASDTLVARDEYRAALARAQEIDDAPRAALLWQKLGALAETRGEWADALQAHRQAAINLDANAPSETRIALVDAQATAQLQLAKQARDAGEITQAEEAYRAALDLNEQGSRTRARRVEIFASLGALAAGSADWERAIAANNLALEQLTATNDAPLREPLLHAQADAYRSVGAVRFAQQSFDAANDAYREAFALYTGLDARAEQGESLRQLGNIASAQARWDEANTFYTQALGQLDSAETRAAAQTAQANALTHIGDAHSQAQAWGQAEIAYLQARGNLEQLGKGAATGGLLAQLGVVTAAQGRPQEALAFFEQARARLRAPDEIEQRAQATRAQASTLRQIADMRRGAGDWAQAEAAYRQQLDLAQELQAATLESDALHHLGLISADRENWDDAIQFYDSALAHLDETAPANTRALIQRHQLSAYEKLGERERAARQFPQAEMAYRSALAYTQALRETEREADCLNVLGLLSIEQENWDEALFNLRRALGIYNLMPAAPQKPQVIWNIGRAQRGSKRKQMEAALAAAAQMETAQDFDGALREYSVAAQLAQEVGERSQQADALYRLGQLQARQTRWQQALLHFDDALALAETESFTTLREQILASQQDALRALANKQRLNHQTDSAEENYNRALGLALERNDRANAGELYFVLGALAADQNAWEKALGNYALALDQVEPAHHGDVKTYQALAFQNWGDAQRAAGQFDAAASAYASALQAADELNDDERAANVLYRAGLLRATMGHWDQALELYEQAQARGAANDPLLREAFISDQQLALRAQTRAQLDAQFFHAQDAEQNAQWQDAATAYRAALQLARALDDAAEQERAQLALVAVYDAQAKSLQTIEMWDEAQIAYRESWNLAREFQLDAPRRERERALLNLGLARVSSYRESGALVEVEQAAQTTLQLAQEFGDTDRQADMLAALGVLAAQQKHWTDAKIYLERARPLLVSTERSDALVNIDQELLTVYDALRRRALQDETLSAAQAALQANDLAQAENSYRQALTLARGLDNPAASAHISATLVKLAADQAHALRATASFPETEQAYRQALAVAHEFNDAAAAHARQQDLIALATEHAQTLRAQKAWDDSAQTYRHALDLAREFGDTNHQAKAHYALGQLAATQNDWQTALDNYNQSVTLLPEPQDTGRVAEIGAEIERVTRARKTAQRDHTRAQGEAARQSEQWQDAEIAYRDSLALSQELDDTAAQGEIQIARAQIAAAQADWTQATALYADALALVGDADARHAELMRQKMQAWQAAGDSAAQQEDWATARANYAQALSDAKQLGDAAATTMYLGNMGDAAAAQNDWQSALGYYDAALQTVDDQADTERHELESRQAAVWQRLGAAEMDAQNLLATQTAYEKASELYARLERPYERAVALHQLGLAHSAQANWHAALDAQQSAYTLARELDAPIQSEIIESLGDAHLRLGNFEAARVEYSQALALTDTPPHAQARLRVALGEIGVTQQHWQDAISHFTAATALYQAQADTAQVNFSQDKTATCYLELGDLNYGEGNWQAADAAYVSALALDKLTGRADRAATIWYRLARADAAQEQYAEALEHYNAALAALDENEIQLRDRILGHLAFTLQQQGKQTLAQGDFRGAQTSLERALKMALASNNLDQAADVSLALGHALAAQEKYAEAQATYRGALAFDERAGNALRAHETNQALANCLLANARADLDDNQKERAQNWLVEAMPYAERSNNPLLRAQILETLGDIASATQLGQAVEYYAQAARQYASLEAMDLWRDVSARQANILDTMAQHQIAREMYADAENSYRRALLLRQASQASDALGETYLGLGRALAAQEQWAAAADAFDNAQTHWQIERAPRGELFALHAQVLEHIGAQALDARKWDDARAAYQRAAEMQDALEARGAAGKNWHKLAQIAVAQEAWHDAADANTLALARLDATDAPETRRQVLTQQAEILGHIGQQQQHAGELGLAAETYRSALDIAQEQGDLSTLAELYKHLGSLAEAQAEWDIAATEYHHALDVEQEMEEPRAQADTWARLGDMHRAAGQFTQASDAYQAARDLYRATNIPLAEGNMLHRLGLTRADAEDWDGALTWYDRALTCYNKHDARAAKIEIYRSMELAVRRAKRHAAQLATFDGDTAMDAGDMPGAEQAYRQALALYIEADERVFQAQMQNQLGVTLEAQGRYDDALEQYQAARLGFQAQEIPAAEISALANIGDVERQRAHWLEAETAYRHALALNQEQDDAARAAELYTLLGQVRQAQNDWEGALDYYQEARVMFASAGQDTTAIEANLAAARRGARAQEQDTLEQALALARENDNRADEGELLNALGLMAAEDKAWDKALRYYRDAVEVFEQLERDAAQDAVWRSAQGIVMNNIGDASRAMSDWRQAEAAYTRALGFAREFQDAESEAILLSNLGLGAQQLREYPRALDLSTQALDKYNALGNATAQPELFERIGALQMQLEQTDAAAQTWQQALRAAKEANDAERAARLLTRLGSLAEGRDADAEALAYYTRALPLTQELGQSQQAQALQFRLGQLYARREEWQAAQDAYAEAYALALAQDDAVQQANAATQLGIVAAQRDDWRAALEYNETALTLTDASASLQTRAELYQRVGAAHLALNENSDAERAYRSALEIAETAPDTSTVSALWLKLAELAEQQAHWQNATAYFARARQTLPADTAAATHIEFALRQGDAALNIPDRDIAQTCYDEAFELALAQDDRAWLGSCYERLGTLAQSRREWDDALAQLQEAIEIQREIHAPLGEARILNDIARLKLEMQNAPEAELFAQAALAIAQAFGSATETSRSLYARALAAAETQELDLAERFLTQAIAADPNNVAAQLQLGNTLLALGRVGEAKLQAETGMGRSDEWELGAQAQLTIAALNSDDTRAFRRSLKQTRARANADAENRRVSADFLRAVRLIIAALEGNAENALSELAQMREEPGLPTTLDAAQFARTALLALAASPRRFRGKPALNTFFASPKPRTRKGARRKDAANGGASESSAHNSESA